MRPSPTPPPTPARNTTATAAAFVVVAGLLLGTAGTAGALGPDGITPLGLGGLRLTAGAVALTAVLPLLGGRWANLPALVKRPSVWVMAAGSAAYQPLFFGAVRRSGVALSTLVAVGSGPIVTGLMGWALLRHRPTAAWAGATTVAIAGLVLRSWGDLTVDDELGLTMAIGAGICSSCYVLAAQRALDDGGHVIELPATAYLLGAVLLAPLVVREPLGWATGASGVALLAYLGIVTMALANVLQVRGIDGLSPGPTATLMLADPLTATILGLAVLDEELSATGLAGSALVLVALVAQARALSRPTRAHASASAP
jgi:DME family drug/metabolite transporter